MKWDFKIPITIVVCFMASVVSAQDPGKASFLNHAIFRYGGLERADTTEKNIYLTFTGGDFNDGGKWISRVLQDKGVPAHFFFTGDFYRSPENKKLIKKLRKKGHYLGPHSDKHLLYASWTNRDSLLVSKEEFTSDLKNNYQVMEAFGIKKKEAIFFMPPYEWYNQQISDWTDELGLILINYTPGTRSSADYTTPDMGNRYIGSQEIYERILSFESTSSSGLNGFILLIHIGTAAERTDKFYYRLEDLITELENRDYQFKQLTEYYKQ
jgi:endoglucanase